MIILKLRFYSRTQELEEESENCSPGVPNFAVRGRIHTPSGMYKQSLSVSCIYSWHQPWQAAPLLWYSCRSHSTVWLTLGCVRHGLKVKLTIKGCFLHPQRFITGLCLCVYNPTKRPCFRATPFSVSFPPPRTSHWIVGQEHALWCLKKYQFTVVKLWRALDYLISSILVPKKSP